MKTPETDETDERPLTSEDTGNPPLAPAREWPGGQEILPFEKLRWAPPLSTEPMPPDISSFGGG